MDRTSGCVGLLGFPGEPVALGEHFIDFVNLLLAMAGRLARAEWRCELHIWRVLPSHPPAGETPGLARQIVQRQLEGLEPPAETLATHEAIGWWSGSGGRAGWPQGIIREEMDARGIPRELSAGLAQLREIFPRIEELERGP